MRFRLLMRACFVAAETAGDLGLDWFIRSQPSSEKPISMLGILLAGLRFLRPLQAAAKDFATRGGVRRAESTFINAAASCSSISLPDRCTTTTKRSGCATSDVIPDPCRFRGTGAIAQPGSWRFSHDNLLRLVTGSYSAFHREVDGAANKDTVVLLNDSQEKRDQSDRTLLRKPHGQHSLLLHV
jgi:hypothetical protein